MGGAHYFVLRQGGGRIFVTSLHFTIKKHPYLHYHSLHRILHTNTSVQYCWQPWSSGLPVATRRSSSPAPYAYHELTKQWTEVRVLLPCAAATAKAHHRRVNSSAVAVEGNTVGHVPIEIWRVCWYFLARNDTITCKVPCMRLRATGKPSQVEKPIRIFQKLPQGLLDISN